METDVASSLTPVAQQIAEKRYFRKDSDGNCIEDWSGLAQRVVNHVCKTENDEYKSKIYDLIFETRFLPNSPCLVNSGTPVGGLLACFVTKSPEDSWEGFIENKANFGYVARRGGGCGVDFSLIRPEGDKVFGSTHAKACGPIQHMRTVSEDMASITQAGFRGMANMGTLRVNHPDIEKFIVCKQREFALKCLLKEDIFSQYDDILANLESQAAVVLDKFISNFNISVVATDEFMQAVENDADFDLVFDNTVYKTVKAKELFNKIVHNAWKNGDPGLLFYNAMNSGPYKHSGQELTATNPCGEQMLPQYGSCNLGSIDVSKYYDDGLRDVNWDALSDAIHTAVQFLDNVISANKFPTSDFTNWAKNNRPVGLGIMGWADLLLKKRIAYGSPRSLEYASELAKFFAEQAHTKSVQLGKDKGTPKSCQYKELDFRRNATTISIAPTGSISLLAGCNGSIEPVYSPTIFMYNNTGSYEMPHPSADKSYFRSAVDPSGEKEVTWQQHIDMQAAFQEHCDSGISKTINMKNEATEADVSKAYMRAWKSGCKGVTIYRDGSKTAQVLNTKAKGTVGGNNAAQRPKDIPADIFKTTADGFNWHVIVGLVGDNPYEVFAVNGKVDLPHSAKVVKHKKRHYSLMDADNNILIDNLVEEEKKIHPRVSLETRRFSLELRHGIHPRYIVSQIDKSHEVITSFSKAVGRILNRKYVDIADYVPVASDSSCPNCAKEDKQVSLVNEAGCWRCSENCGYSKCG